MFRLKPATDILGFHLKLESVLPAVLVILVLVSWSPRLRGPIDLRWDAGVYYVLGTALAEGKGYRLLNEPGEIQAIQYPPLMPAAVAAWEILAGTSDPLTVGRWLRLQSLVCFTLFVLAAYALARRYVSPGMAFVVGVLCLVNERTHFMSDQGTADLPFALTTTAFLFFATARSPSRAQALLAGALCIASYLVRTAGIGLMLAWVVEALVNRRFRAASYRTVICAFPVAAWTLYIAHVEQTPDYLQPTYTYQRADYLFYNVTYGKNALLKDPLSPEAGRIGIFDILTERVLPNLCTFPVHVAESLTSPKPFWEEQRRYIKGHIPRIPLPRVLVPTLLFFIGGLVICGAVMFLIRQRTLLALYMLFSGILLCATPWPDQMNRYLIPLNPLSALFLVHALGAIESAVRRRLPIAFKWVSQAGVVAVLVFLIGGASWTLVRVYGEYFHSVVWRTVQGGESRYALWFYHPSYSALDAGLDWLKEHADQHDVLASSMPHTAYIRTGLRSVMVPFVKNPELTQRYLDEVPTTFLVVQRGGPVDMDPYIGNIVASSSEWTNVYSDADAYVRIYRRKKLSLSPQ